MRLSLSLVAPALALVGGCKQPVREPADHSPVKWTLTPAVSELRAAAVTPVHLAATIDDGWYIYSVTQKAGGPTPMTVSVAPSPPFRIEGNVSGPVPVVVFDKEFNIDTERYQGTASFTVPVATTLTTGGQPQALDVKVRFQACNETLCLPARTVTLTNRVQVAVR